VRELTGEMASKHRPLEAFITPFESWVHPGEAEPPGPFLSEQARK